MQIRLPQPDGRVVAYELKASPIRPKGASPAFNRTVYAAAHVVIDPSATLDPWDASPQVDWDTTLAFREHLYKLGFKVAEAMDTAQRGMGLDWPTSLELIDRSLVQAFDLSRRHLLRGLAQAHVTNIFEQQEPVLLPIVV